MKYYNHNILSTVPRDPFKKNKNSLQKTFIMTLCNNLKTRMLPEKLESLRSQVEMLLPGTNQIKLKLLITDPKKWTIVSST